jgi:hypothetical protein
VVYLAEVPKKIVVLLAIDFHAFLLQGSQAQLCEIESSTLWKIVDREKVGLFGV